MISPTEGELTSRRAMHRSARTALHSSTTLHCSTPLCIAIHLSILLYSLLLCSASPKLWREKPVSPSTQKTLSFSFFFLRMVGERLVAPTLAPWKSGEEICVTKSDTASWRRIITSCPSRAALDRFRLRREGGRRSSLLTHVEAAREAAERPSPFPTPTS